MLILDSLWLAFKNLKKYFKLIIEVVALSQQELNQTIIWLKKEYQIKLQKSRLT